MTASNSIEQRWAKPDVYAAEPGHWKKQLPTKFLKLAEGGKVEALQRLLEDHPDSLNKRGNHGRTLLWEACRKGRMEAVDYLLAAGADCHVTGCYGSESHVQLDCLSAARFYNRPDIAERLLQIPAKPDFFRSCFLGDRPRVEAVLRTSPELLEQEDPADEIFRIPPLAFAVAGGHGDMVEAFIAAGAPVAPYSTLLLFLIGLLDRQTFLAPLVKAGLDVSVIDSSTFLVARSLDCLEELLAVGAPVNQAGLAGVPPLVQLCRPDRRLSLDKIQLLLAKGTAVNAPGPRGKTALHHAARRGQPELVALLLRSGADASLRDDDGQTPRDIAIALGKPDLF